MGLRVTTLRGLGQEAVVGDNAIDPSITAAEAAASNIAWDAVKKGIIISAVLTGIQIIYDVRCARKCSAVKK